MLLTFISRRCPFEDFCPRISSNCNEIDNRWAGILPRGFSSVSFDAEHDTPKVLRDYAFLLARMHVRALIRCSEFAVPSVTDLPEIEEFLGAQGDARGPGDHPQSEHDGNRSRQQDHDVVSRRRLAGF